MRLLRFLRELVTLIGALASAATIVLAAVLPLRYPLLLLIALLAALLFEEELNWSA